MSRHTSEVDILKSNEKVDKLWGQFKEVLIITERIAHGDKSVEIPADLNFTPMQWYTKIYDVGTKHVGANPCGRFSDHLKEYVQTEFAPSLLKEWIQLAHEKGAEVDAARLFNAVAAVQDQFLHIKRFTKTPFLYVNSTKEPTIEKYGPQSAEAKASKLPATSDEIFDNAFRDMVYPHVQHVLLQSIRQVTLRGNGIHVDRVALKQACRFNSNWVSDSYTYIECLTQDYDSAQFSKRDGVFENRLSVLNPIELMAFLLHSSPALNGNASEARPAAATEQEDEHEEVRPRWDVAMCVKLASALVPPRLELERDLATKLFPQASRAMVFAKVDELLLPEDKSAEKKGAE